MSRVASLPIDTLLPEIVAALHRSPSLVIEAPPGAGKTSRVPPALLSIVKGEVIVLEPRRLAARLAARRAALELGEKVGETIGYQVRFDEVAGPRTRLRFVTEGVLTRRLLSDPELRGVDAVVLDEFHERHLEGDLALALLRRLQAKRPNLLLVVMSATLDAAPIARYLGDCPVARSEGRMFELSLEHLPYSPDPLHVQVRRAVERLISDGYDGDILTFLPGAAEIRKAARECDPIARKAAMLVLPLHGDLSPAEQDLAVSPQSQRKLILSTNVAESSVTVDGVNAVIDSGLARFASHSVWSGLPTLQIGRISKASANQRAGRAGRTGPGRVIRLYPREDYALRPEHDAPEIARSDLSQLCLTLRAAGISAADVDWFEPPPAPALLRAEALLDRLGATGKRAQQLARYPLTPRLARILVEALERGVGEDGCRITALLGSGVRSGKTDLLEALDSTGSPESSHDYRFAQHLSQLRRIARPARQQKHDEDALLISVLSGFPDRVARRRPGNQILMSAGGSAELSGEPLRYGFMIAIDAEERKELALPLVRTTARVEPEWLLDLFPERVREVLELTWSQVAERVEARSALLYDELVLEESQAPHPDPEAVTDLLVRKVLESGVELFVDRDEFANLLARAEFAGCEPPDIPKALRAACSGSRSFAEVRRAAPQLLAMLEHTMDRKSLAELAPVSIRLQAGRVTRVHYEAGKAPWIASRLQDFFGMRTSPVIGPHRTPVVVHLLGPNHRAVQTTSDLAGFWERLYPQVRRELMRKYPKHAWPETP